MVTLEPIHDRNSHWRCSIKKGLLKNFAKFTGKHLCQSLSKKRPWYRCFPVNFAKFLRTLSTEHLQETASNIKFIYIENVVRLVLFVVLSWLPKIWFDRWFFLFLFMVAGRGINIYLQRWTIDVFFCLDPPFKMQTRLSLPPS